MRKDPGGDDQEPTGPAGPPGWDTPGDEGSVVAGSSVVPEVVRDLWDLLVAYTRQETIEPLRNVGRFLFYGVGGMLVVTIGVFLLCMSALRALQTQTNGVFDGFWSWVPYLIVAVGVGGLVTFAFSRIGRGGVGGDRR